MIARRGAAVVCSAPMRDRASLLKGLCLAGVLVACRGSNEPARPGPRPPGPAPTAAADVQLPPVRVAENLEIDPQRTRITFTVSTNANPPVEHTGRLTSFRGDITFAPEGVAASGVMLFLDFRSLELEPAALRTALLGPAFLNVEQFPEGRFRSMNAPALQPTDGGPTNTIAGDLFFRGLAHPLSFPATVTPTPEGLTARAEFTLLRHEWGMDTAAAPGGPLRDEVRMRLELVARRRH